MVDYTRWDDLYDSDEERKRDRFRKEGEAARKRKEAAARAPKPPKVDWSKVDLDDPSTLEGMPPGMSEYMKAMSCGQYGAAKNKDKYKLPESDEEKRAKASEAKVLKDKGNNLYAQNEFFEAAKLYELAVLKFDWYAEQFADEAERAIVLPVKIPCHLNLAMMSLSLGNYQHAVVHCTQVLKHDPDNAKALFRRGVCHTHLGMLVEAKADLLRAKEIIPNDGKLIEALAKLRLKIQEYNRRCKNMSSAMVSVLGDEEGELATADDAGGQDDGDGAAVAHENVEDLPTSVTACDGADAPTDGVRGTPPAIDGRARAGSTAWERVLVVSEEYRCAECAPAASSGWHAVRHPVLGLICGTCHLVLVDNQLRVPTG
mmetsp:Transcript_20627/g.55668  ORF Transcript_20627/g.55668 Transcript_20627/m.55668 type:complete len:372 (+) Transcript_20627:86-1201(+)